MQYVEIACRCGAVHRVAPYVQKISCACGELHETSGRQILIARLPRGVEFISRFRLPGEVGVGDTVERLIAVIGGRPLMRFKSLLESLSIDCGCTSRRDWLNRMYPYEPAANQPEKGQG